MSTAIITDDDRQRLTARRVTVGTIVVMLLVALSGLEAWPLTSFRLFSTVRTGSSVSLQLVAVGADGTRTSILLPRDQVLNTTTHQLPDLKHESTRIQREKVDAWLAGAGIDASHVAVVELVRTTRTADADHRPVVGTTTVVVRVVP